MAAADSKNSVEIIRMGEGEQFLLILPRKALAAVWTGLRRIVGTDVKDSIKEKKIRGIDVSDTSELHTLICDLSGAAEKKLKARKDG